MFSYHLILSVREIFIGFFCRFTIFVNWCLISYICFSVTEKFAEISEGTVFASLLCPVSNKVYWNFVRVVYQFPLALLMFSNHSNNGLESRMNVFDLLFPYLWILNKVKRNCGFTVAYLSNQGVTITILSLKSKLQ